MRYHTHQFNWAKFRGCRLQGQDKRFFVNVGKLHGKRLNPKFDLTLEQVIKSNVDEVFGKVSKFKTINSNLHVKTWRKIIELYVKIYGTTKPSNNELMSWVVKGYITEVKGFEINWAEVASCITREKACRETTKKMMKLHASKVSGNELFL